MKESTSTETSQSAAPSKAESQARSSPAGALSDNAPAVDESGMSVRERNEFRAKRLGDAYLKYYYDQSSQVLFQDYPRTTSATNWEYGGMMSMVVKLARIDKGKYKGTLENIFDGNDYYGYYENNKIVGFVVDRKSVRTAQPGKAMAYDDNMWDITEYISGYEITSNRKYLDQAIRTTDFLIRDAWNTDTSTGGFYWDYRKGATHACSNAPMIEVFVRLYEHTKEQKWLDWAKKTFDFCLRLRMSDGCLEDLIGTKPSDRPGGGFHSYNTGSFVYGCAALYRVTKDEKYLNYGKESARGAYNRFSKSSPNGLRDFPLTTTPWFTAIMVKGWVALLPYDADCRNYLVEVQKSIDYAYNNFIKDDQIPRRWLESWTTNNGGQDSERSRKWALDQGANAEIYGILAGI